MPETFHSQTNADPASMGRIRRSDGPPGGTLSSSFWMGRLESGPMSDFPRPELPGGWTALERLSAGDDSGSGAGEDVWRVARADRQAVLRCVPESAADRWRGEIDALSAGHVGVAGLVAFGRLPDGRLGVWREWVPGEPLDRWAKGRDTDERARVCARLAGILASLHASGAVHGDLKAQNVIVRPDGEPMLTDFGLGGGERAAGAGGGSLLGLAPECLAGAPADERADLFAFGSLLHGLLAGRFPNPRELYARFPGEDYLTASGIPAAELPEWSRGLVGALLEREPERRPESADAVARDLAARTGERVAARARALRFEPLCLREDWVEGVRRSLTAGRERAWRLPVGEDPVQLAHALRAQLVTTEPALVDLVVDGDELRCADGVVRWVAPDDARPCEGECRELPGHDARALTRFLESRLDAPRARCEALAARLVTQGSGADAIDRELVRLQRRGTLVAGPRGWRYEGEGPAHTIDRGALEELSERRLSELIARVTRGAAAIEEAHEEFLRVCREGRPQRALAWLADLRDALGADLPADLCADEALAWFDVGRAEDTERILRQLESCSDAPTRALVLRARGRLAARRTDHESARDAFQEALLIDPDDGGESVYCSVRLAFERGELDAVATHLAEASTQRLSERTAWDLEALAAMTCLRRGDVDEARRRLDAQIERAQADDASEALAVALSNRGVVERRAGRLAIAVRDFEESLDRYARLGSVAGCTRVEQLLGGALRELGDLRRAEASLRRAIEAEESRGDGAGATAGRGSLGLLLADRGHARAAIDELTAGADALRRAGRTVDTAWMETTRAELATRVGAGEPPKDADPAPDPRVFLAAARTARWWKRTETAVEWARRAGALAAKIGNAAMEEEARWIELRAREHAVIGERGDANDVTNTTWRVPRLAQDAAVLRWLATPPATMDGDAALAFARELERLGRDDRAARLAGAVALRSRSKETARAAADFASDAFARAAAGLTDAERDAFARRLLDGPDEHPEEAEVLLYGLPEELLDMDALALLEINHRLVEQQKLDELCREIVRSAVRMSGAERGFLVLEEDGDWSFDTALSSRHGAIDEPEVEVSSSILRRALDEGRPVRSSNALDDPNFEGARSVVELNLRSILCTPFTADEGLRGVLYLDHRVAEEVFDERAERLLGLLADQAALAIRQVQRMEEIQRLNGMLRERVATQESDLAAARRALQDAEAVVPASGLVGDSAPMREVHRVLQLAARAELPTLITGESGTGKELAARAVHSMGPRAKGPFVAENCAALPESLIESELFGAEKGAFTGADKSRPGLFERAHGGTLFLDELGELPLGLQAKLLRVLETGVVRRVGGEKERRVDVRLVAATNRDLEAESAAGRFRADLMYRLDAMRILLPPLAARVEDIPALVDHFLRIEATRSGVERRVTQDVLAALARRAWPGNVRELANEVARLCALSSGDLDDPTLVRDPAPTAAPPAGVPLTGTLEEIERRAIEAAIEANGGDKGAAAKQLGISRAKVYQRWKSWREDEE